MCRQCTVNIIIIVIEASLSEPHTSGTVLRNPLVYTCTCMYVCMYGTYVGPVLRANVTGSMTSCNNSCSRTWRGRTNGSCTRVTLIESDVKGLK